MKIGFDGKRAAQNRTGLGNYSRFVIRILSQYNPSGKYNLYVPNPKKQAYLNDIPNADNIQVQYPKTWIWKKFRFLWRIFGIKRDLEKNKEILFHGLSNELPLNIRKVNCKSIVTIHDLIFLRFPKCYSWIDRKIYNYKFRKACENANRIIAVSECTKRDIIQFYHIPEDKIDVVYQGCDPAFETVISKTIKQEVKKRYGLPSRFVLFVGSIEERKNMLLLVKALQHLPEEITIVAIGKHTSYTDKVIDFARKAKLTSRLKIIHNVPFKDLPSIYQLSTIFVYPSRFEGFGIPILEALRSGTPVIGCSGSCLEEAGGPDSLYVSPDDDQALARAIYRVWNDEQIQQHMIKKGKEYALRFEDKRLFQDLIKCYEKVLKQ